MNSNYSRLDPRLREYIYEKKWPSLKNIQEETIPAILDTEDHILIAADTAAGKTEACFFPVITELLNKEKYPDNNEAPGIQALYIGPLKALINDQFERLLPLLGELGIALWRWHGDVEKNRKQKLLDHPSGILQITPESLEALLLRQSGKIPLLFGRLKFVIIDEVHAFIGTDRGSQLICLLERIRMMTETGVRPRRIGLSATMGNYKSAMDWLCAGTGKNAILVSGASAGSVEHGRRLSLAVDYYRGGDEEFYSMIYEQCRPGSSAGVNAGIRKCIIFTNSRIEAEQTTAALKKIAAGRGEQDYYQVHHGSIAAALREETEKNLREIQAARSIIMGRKPTTLLSSLRNSEEKQLSISEFTKIVEESDWEKILEEVIHTDRWLQDNRKRRKEVTRLQGEM
ncbi:MAG: DEAD/DEAH box helicase, partial [Treponema sp.]|nr:DEAD/DEAH box helicase [Treponema sp.]